MIEKQRAALQELQKHEQLNELKERRQAAEERRRLQAQLNREANEQIIASYTANLDYPSNTLRSGALEASDPRASGLLKNQSNILPNRRSQLTITHLSGTSSEGGDNQF